MGSPANWTTWLLDLSTWHSTRPYASLRRLILCFGNDCDCGSTCYFLFPRFELKNMVFGQSDVVLFVFLHHLDLCSPWRFNEALSLRPYVRPTRHSLKHQNRISNASRTMIPIIPTLALVFVSFLSSAFVILRILIPILPPNPLSRRVPPVSFFKWWSVVRAYKYWSEHLAVWIWSPQFSHHFRSW